MSTRFNLYKYIFPVFLLACMQALWSPVFGRDSGSKSTMNEDPAVEKKKSYQKTFPLSGVTLFELSNQFGNVVIVDHNAQEAKVEVDITVSAKDEENAQTLLDAISIEESLGKTLRLETKLASRKNSKNTKLSINYKVWLPGNLAIDLKNQFGNLDLPNWKGRSNIVVKFGNLQTGTLANNNEVRVEFGQMKTGAVYGGKITGQYSNVVIGSINGSVTCNFDFCKNPEITVGKDFEGLSVSNSYSSIRLYVPADYKGKFDIRTSFSSLKNNSAFAINEDKVGDERGPKFDKDYLGQAGNSDAVIKVKSSFGDVTIK